MLSSRRFPHCSRPLVGVTSNFNITSPLLRRKLTRGLNHTASGFVGRARRTGFQHQSVHLNNSGAAYEMRGQSI